MRATTRLRQLIASGRTSLAPGVFDGLSARLVEMAGFELMYASGGAVARSAGVPDLGLLDVGEIVSRLQQIVDAVDIPVIADADTGYGNALNARRAARSFERAGVAGLHMEDQVFPKRCGHYENKALVSSEEFEQKLRAVRDALRDPDFVVIARTDAIAIEGFDAALKRASRYAEAGADVVFIEAPTSVEQVEEIASRIAQPKLINMFHGGKTPMMPLRRLEELGYAIVLSPNDVQRAAIGAMQRTLEVLRRDGSSASLESEMIGWQEREAVVRTSQFLELDRRYGI